MRFVLQLYKENVRDNNYNKAISSSKPNINISL